jgi:tetratricopeptide (TPR) repeat protein
MSDPSKESPYDYKQREAYLAFVKGWYYGYQNKTNRALEHLEYSLALREETNVKTDLVFSILSIAWIRGVKLGELDSALTFAKRGATFAKECKNIYLTAFSLNVLGAVHSLIGEMDQSIRYYEESLALFTKLDNKHRMAAVLGNLGGIYRLRGEYDRALEYLEQTLELRYERGNLRDISNAYHEIILILFEKNDLEKAEKFLIDFEQINNQLKNKEVDAWYRYSKGLLLKNNARARNRVKAEEIFKSILEEEGIELEITIGALLNICDLLLIELRAVNDLEVLGEIEQYISQLSDFAEKSQSYWILCETHLLQAKLSLITFNIKKAQRFLTQAQQIAERFNLKQLETKIANEKSDLLKKLDLWEKLKEAGAPMAERFELARLDEQISGMVENRSALSSQIKEDVIAIHKEKKICLVCRGEVLRFSYICECGAIYCDSCARAVTDLENVCWVCEVPIDISKPVKPHENGASEVVSQKTHKKE